MDTININGVEYVKKDSIATEDGLTWCVIRCENSGVFVAMVDYENVGILMELKRSRRLWYWDGASSLSELAVKGVSRPDNCKFPCEVPMMTVTDVIEVIPMTDEAVASINAVPIWSNHE